MNNIDEMTKNTGQCVLFFTKWPVPGRVKTRLGKQVGFRCAAELYQSFVTDLMHTLKTLNCTTVCCCDPHTSAQAYEDWLGPDHLYQVQAGSDLGQRLCHAFNNAFDQGFDRVIAIGTDSPDIPQHYLQQALTSLVYHDVTIGPSQDGGYYLIGFSRKGFLPNVFQDIQWSTDKVLEQTYARLEQHQAQVHNLPDWYDIDTLEDLNQLHDRRNQRHFSPSDAIAAINKKGLHSAGRVQDGSV